MTNGLEPGAAQRVFDYEDKSIRVIMRNGEPWFVAKDVCDVLEHSNSRMAVDRLDEDEKGVSIIYTPGGNQEMAVVNEPGLYSLILTSRVAKAREFKRWVTHVVIPSIRRTGTYSAAFTSVEDLIIAQAQSVKELKARVAQIEERAVAAHHRIDNLDTVNIEGDLRQRLEKMVKRYAWSAGISFSTAWRHFDQSFNTAFRTNLTALRQNYCARNGLESITRPDYLERVGRLEDAIRIADKLLNTKDSA